MSSGKIIRHRLSKRGVILTVSSFLQEVKRIEQEEQAQIDAECVKVTAELIAKIGGS